MSLSEGDRGLLLALEMYGFLLCASRPEGLNWNILLNIHKVHVATKSRKKFQYNPFNE